ncbi:hypothetical protein H7U37_12710 [Pseudoflavonifractor phocaeensis]|uniref:hypothetical protein n=1 Tax=Pseudoflavonifractor phocaeensis TaxID=1870988 RepID=UPI00195B837D|nr:hypothetical protein [Pseudoflavonifractor phocaeensis]MBM6939374.1 hypothetical protein [Pseudoflavonifractor phocaeensis]
MLKRELIRILALMLLGLVLGTLLGVPPGLERFLGAPLYVVGIFYAGRTFLGLLGRLLSTYAHYQMMSLMFHSLSAALLCLVLLALGLAAVCTIGWLFGLVRCAAALISAAQLDRSLRESPEEWSFR